MKYHYKSRFHLTLKAYLFVWMILHVVFNFSNHITMKNISIWGKNNPWKARLIIAVAHFMLVAIAVLIGVWSYIDDVRITNGMMITVLLIFILTAFFYPIRGSRSMLFGASYHRRKKSDALLLLSATFLLSGGVNQFCFAPVYENVKTPVARQVVHRNTEAIRAQPSIYEKKATKESLRIQKKNLKHKVKVLKKEIRTEEPMGNNFLLRLFLGMITLAAMFGFLVVISNLACQLSCAGMGGAAFLVSIGGLGLAIFLTIIIFRSIARLRQPYENKTAPPTNEAEKIVPAKRVIKDN
jgi:hypothetical protein